MNPENLRADEIRDLTADYADFRRFVFLCHPELPTAFKGKGGQKRACDAAYLGARPEAFVTSAGAFEGAGATRSRRAYVCS
jgi:hypothetical protein